MTRPPNAGYDLFVSYATKDARRWVGGRRVNIVGELKRALEQHTIVVDGARRRFRVCTDVEDFELDTTVHVAIRRKLALSRHLLVISTAASSTSAYVREELSLFAELHPDATPLAALVDLPPHTAFPGVFREDVLCVNLSINSSTSPAEWRARLVDESHKVVARVCNVPLHEIHDRFEQERRAARKRTIGVSAAVGVTLALTSGYALHKARRVAEAESERLGEQARDLAAQPGREVEAVVTAIEAVGPRPAAPEPKALAGLFAAVTSAKYCTPLRGHVKPITAAAVSHSETMIATGAEDGEIRLWHGETGQLRRVLRQHQAAIVALAYRRDERMLAAGDQSGRVVLHELRTPQRELALDAPLQRLPVAPFSPDGTTLVTAGQDGTVRLWSSGDGALLETITAHRDVVWDAVFSPDGRHLATCSSDGDVKVWSLDSRTDVQTFRVDGGGAALWAVFSPDGSRIATGHRFGTISVWDRESGARLVGHRVEFPTNPWRSEFSDDGRLVLGGNWASPPTVWDVASGRIVSQLVYSEQRIQAYFARFARGGAQVVTAQSTAGEVVLWDTATAKPVTRLSGHSNEITAILPYADGHVLTASKDGTARLWHLPHGDLATLHVNEGADNALQSARYIGPDAILATGRYSLTSWDARKGVRRRRFTVPARQSIVAVSRDARYVATTQLVGQAFVRDATTGHAIALGKQDNEIQHAAFSPDGTRLATADLHGNARIWDVRSGAMLRQLGDGRGDAVAVAWSPDGRLLLTGERERIARLWDATSGQAGLMLAGHTDRVVRVDFAPDGTRALTGSLDGTARLWDVRSGRCLAVLPAHTNALTTAAFAGDERILTTSLDGTAALWHGRSGALVQRFQGHDGIVHSAALSDDGRLVATSSADGTVRLWDAESGVLIARIEQRNVAAVAAAFSPDATRLIGSWSDGTIRVFPIAASDLLDLARTLIRDQAEFRRVEHLVRP